LYENKFKLIGLTAEVVIDQKKKKKKKKKRSKKKKKKKKKLKIEISINKINTINEHTV